MMYTNMKECSWFNKQLILFIQGSPAISMHCTATFPMLKVQCGPCNIEECKYDETDVISVLKHQQLHSVFIAVDKQI